MKAINYLGSMLSQKTSQIPNSTIMRCMQLILERYERAQRKQGAREDMQTDSSSHRVFNHCFYQNMALIFASKHEIIKLENPDLFNKLSKLLFQRKFGSLEYASPFILEELLESTKGTDEDGEKTELPDNRQMQHIARKVKSLMDS